MIDHDYLWEECVKAADPHANIRELDDPELRKLAAHASHLVKRNGNEGGVPSLIYGLCELEAASRFFIPSRREYVKASGTIQEE
jgi:hypothetical protein